MAAQSSVAPRERINIVYKSTAEGAAEEVELPLKLLVLGDFSGRQDDTPVEHRRQFNIHRNNFDEVMAAAGIGLETVVDNCLDEQSAELPVRLRFDSIADFDPDRVAAQVPELGRLLQLRLALTTLKGPLGNIPSFRKSLQAIMDDEDSRERVIRELQQLQGETLS